MNQKERWILKNIPDIGVDILNADFVDSFIIKFDVSFKFCNWGAHKCLQLNRLLGQMYKKGLLKRGIIGLSGGSWQPGFPKWVYVYSKEKYY